MKMGSNRDIESIEKKGEIYICPNCGYTDGFHISFDLASDNHAAEIILICPSCHRRFRVGFEVTLKD